LAKRENHNPLATPETDKGGAVVHAKVLGLLLRLNGLGAGGCGGIVPGGDLDRVIRHPLDVARVAPGCCGAAGAKLPACRWVEAQEIGQQLGSAALSGVTFGLLRVHAAPLCV